MRDRRWPELDGCGKYRRRRSTLPKCHLSNQRHRGGRRARVAAAVAIEREAGGQQVIRRGHENGLQIDARCRDTLLGIGEDVQAEDADRKKGDGRRGRELNRQQIAQQTLGLLVVGGQR